MTDAKAGSFARLFHASPALQRLMERVALKTHLPAGTLLFQKDEEADSIFVLDEGEIEISVTSVDGRKLALEILTPPEVFGEIGLFAGRRTADATTLGPVRLRRVRRSDFLASLRDEPDLSIEIIELLCARLRDISDKLEERAFKPLPTRIARRILHLSEKYADRGGTIPLSQAELADFAGATREAVAKTLGQWRAQGWIDLPRGALSIKDRAPLELLASSDEG